MDKVKKIIIIIPSILILIILSSIIYNHFTPKIELIGDSEVIVNYNKEYKDKGYKAYYKNKDITDKVKVKGKVNIHKLGVYNITYIVKYGNITKKVKRKVLVRDTEKPKITIDAEDNIYVCPGEVYKVPKYMAYDNYDKDITNKVVVKKRNDAITFEVIDSSGNISHITKKVIYKDVDPPKLELNGEKEMVVFLDDNYNEEGYTISDNCDKDVKNKVEVKGSVDTKKVGAYEIIYKAFDKYENEVTVKRRVNVIRKGGPGTIYLTFDDGPKEDTTSQILDILKSENVKATFFVTNNGPDYLIKREFDEGHEVALHTATHDYSYVYSSVENYFNDINSVHDRVKNLTGYDAKLIRFPGGSSNTVSRKYYPGIMSILTKEIENKGFKHCDWNISSGDAGETTDPNGVYNNVISRLSHDRINVVLMHDIKTYTKDALLNIIRYGKENGYYFDKLNYYQEMVHQSVNN